MRIVLRCTGYLPELVIKGDRTVPEFGGGLCQVSTTLFRAVMDSGLPVTARRNHSYRVSYYEKDGNGKVIGPGLDATIYEPDVDFKFKNDMSTPVLIIGYVIGDKVTFELYGTKDGRTSKIDGPKKLTETAPGEPVYIETTDLAPGVIKQVETPHPGGSAVATYTISAVPDPVGVLREMKRVVKPGGNIVVLNHFRSERPAVGRLEDLVAPVCTRLGWKSNLPLEPLLKQVGLVPDITAKVNLFNGWRLIRCVNPK